MLTTLPLTTGTWTFDAAHSGVHFKVRHLGLTNVRGRFNGIDASLVVGEDLAGTSVGATIDIGSVDTNNADRDAHLRTTDFFAADAHPTITFASTAIRDEGDGEYEADGDLTINGVTKPVTLKVEFTGEVVHPGDGKAHAGFIATAQILRDDFGIDFNMPLGVDKFALGKKIDIDIDVQFVAPAAG
ncbi:MAG: YceI family protein [Ilumatobacteraceae bacterium]